MSNSCQGVAPSCVSCWMPGQPQANFVGLPNWFSCPSDWFSCPSCFLPLKSLDAGATSSQLRRVAKLNFLPIQIKTCPSRSKQKSLLPSCGDETFWCRDLKPTLQGSLAASSGPSKVIFPPVLLMEKCSPTHMQEIKLMPTLLSCQISFSTLEKKTFGLASVGHFGFFQVQFQRQTHLATDNSSSVKPSDKCFVARDAPQIFRGRQIFCSPSDLCNSHSPFYRGAFSGTENIFRAKVIYDVEQRSRFWSCPPWLMCDRK